jgi:hypothetical protein
LSKRFLSVNIASKSLKYSLTFWRFIILHLQVPVFSGFLIVKSLCLCLSFCYQSLPGVEFLKGVFNFKDGNLKM